MTFLTSRSIFGLTVLICLSMVLPGVARSQGTGGGQSAPVSRVQSALTERLAAEGGRPVRFLVKLKAGADLQAASLRSLTESAGLPPRTRLQQQRAAVVETLRATAEQSQVSVLQQTEQLQQAGHITAVDPLWVVNAVVVTGDEEAVRRLAQSPEVEGIYLDEWIARPSHAAELQSTTLTSETLWNLDMIGVPEAWTTGADGAGVVVASLDGGVDVSHPELKLNFRGFNPEIPEKPNVSGNWRDFTWEGYLTPVDLDGHGTHTTATVLGYNPEGTAAIGVAPRARWIAARAWTAQGAYLSWIMNAGQWLMAPEGRTDLAPDIINNSWGAEPGGNPVFQDMVRSWRSAGILPVFSIGNSGPAADTASSPGDYPESLAVGAVDAAGLLASFSSRGPSRFSGITKPDLSAPGVRIVSAVPGGYALGSGTSMAAPHVAGVAALLLSVAPDMTVADLERTLKSTVTPLTDAAYPSSPNSGYGAGLVDALSAVAAGGVTGAVQGRVADAGTGAPLAATVSIKETGQSQTTSPYDNRFSFHLAPGTYTVKVTRQGYFPAEQTVTVVKGQRTVLSLALRAQGTGTLQGRVTDRNTGLGVAGSTVRLTDGGRKVETATAWDGTYSMQTYEGTYTVEVFGGGYKQVSATVIIEAQGTATYDVALEVPLAHPLDWTHPHGGAGGSNANESPLPAPLVRRWTGNIWATGAAVVGDRIFVSGQWNSYSSKEMRAIDLLTGATLWQRFVSSNSNEYGAPVYFDGRVLSTDRENNLIAFDAWTGATIWTKKFGQAPGTPVAVRGRAFVASGGTLSAFSRTGATLWNAAAFGAQLVADGTRVYAVGTGSVTAFSQDQGQRAWAWSCPCQATRDLTPSVSEGFLLLYNEDGRALYALRAETGELLWTATDIAGAPAIRDGIVYVQMTSGRIIKLRVEDGYRLSSSLNAGDTGGGTFPVRAAGQLIFDDSGRVLDAQTLTEVMNDRYMDFLAAGQNVALFKSYGSIYLYGPAATPAWGLVEGRVTDQATGRPMAGAQAGLEATGHTVRTAEDGTFALAGPIGDGTLVVRARGYADQRMAISVTEGTARRDVALLPVANGVITGVITDAETGRPVEGATLTVLDPSWVPSARTDNAGGFRIEAGAGDYRLRLEMRGYEPVNLDLPVAAGSTVQLTRALVPYLHQPEDWPAAFGGPDGSGRSDSFAAPPLQRAWVYPGAAATSRPVAARGRLYAHTSDGYIRAFDLASGTVPWSVTAGSSTPLAYGWGKLFAVTDLGMTALDPDTGRVIWAGVSGYQVQSLSVVEDQLIVVRSASLEVYDVETGDFRWYQGLNPEGNSVLAAVSDGTVFVASLPQGHGGSPGVTAFDLATGQRRWNRYDCCEHRGSAVAGFGLVMTQGSALSALRADSGFVAWRVPGAVSTPVLGDTQVFVPTADSVLAVSPDDGSVAYAITTTAGVKAAAGRYLFGSGLTVIDLESRQVVGSYLPGAVDVIVAGDHVIALDENRRLTVFRSATLASQTGVIRGRLTSAGGQVPTEATVRIGGRTVRPDNQGRFVLRLPAGSYLATVSAPRWFDRTQAVQVTPGASTYAVISMDWRPLAEVVGKVVRADTGVPIAGARVVLAGHPAGTTAVSDSLGRFRLAAPAGEWYLQVEAFDFRTAYHAVTLSDEAAASPTLRLTLSNNDPPPGRPPLERAFAWEYQAPRPFFQSPIIADGKLVLYDWALAQLIAVDMRSGKPVWQVPFFEVTHLSAGSGVVYHGAWNVLSARDLQTGAYLWSQDVGSTNSAWVPTVLEGGRLFAGTGARLLALDSRSGQIIWTRDVTGGANYLAAGGGKVFASNGYGLVEAADGASGQRRWQASYCTDCSGFSPAELTLAGQVLLVRWKAGGQLVAFDAATGRKLWTARAASPPAVRGEVGYVYEGGAVHALDLANGSQLWEAPVTVAHPDKAPQLWGDYLVVGSAAILDLRTRSVVWQVQGGDRMSPVLGDGHLALANPAGLIEIYRATSNVAGRVTLAGRTDHSGATVTIAGEGGSKILVTGPEGAVDFGTWTPAPGYYQVEVSHPAYPKRVANLYLDAAGTDLGTLRLLYPGDVTGDDRIDTDDLQALLERWRSAPGDLDLVPDGKLDLLDLYEVARRYVSE